MGLSDKIIFINKPTKFSEVIVPDLSYSRCEYYSDHYKNIFDTIINKCINNKTSTNQAKKIFLSRKNWGKGKKLEFGHDMLENYFKKNNFSVVYPEELTIKELICITNNADVVASISGSTAHNSLFFNNVKKFIIIEKTNFYNEIQIDINIIKNMDIDYIDANISLYPADVGLGPFVYAYTDNYDK